MTYFRGLTPEFWSAVAAIFSFLLSVYLVVYNNWKNKKKANSELYALISILIGFVDFVQYIFFHNTTTLRDAIDIVNKIKSLDKNILDYNKDYFYNDEYDKNVLQKTAVFIQRYVAWRGYHCVIDLDVFSEINLTIALQRSAIETLLEIESVYKKENNKISILITKEEMNRISYIYLKNEEKEDHFILIKNNLYLIEASQSLSALYKIREKQEFPLSSLIAACYKVIAEERISFPLNQHTYLDAYQFFFNSKITRVNYDDKNGKHENYFTNQRDEKIEIDKVFDLLHFIAEEK